MFNKIIYLLFLFLSHHVFAQQISVDYLFTISRSDAKTDSLLNDSLYYYFDDFDESIPLKSITFDLNKDGYKEKFIPNDVLCGSGGCPWIIYDSNEEKLLGYISGIIIYINNTTANEYFQIESYWKNGADEGFVMIYEFSDGQYKITNRFTLSGEEINDYFNKKDVTE